MHHPSRPVLSRAMSRPITAALPVTLPTPLILATAVALVIAAALSLFSSGPAGAASPDRSRTPVVTEDASGSEALPGSIVSGLSSNIYQDTVSYGGTWWAPDSLRWEAVRDSCWTFETGVGSSINTGSVVGKPVGYHRTMEGWYGIDATYNPVSFFRRVSTCAINGSFSLWAGATLAEANARCWVAGQGYGNDWDIIVSRSFAYAGSGNVTLSYRYAVDAEPAFDYAYVRIDTTGSGGAPDVELASYNGTPAGTESITLNPGQDMRSTPGNFIIRFLVRSDGSYSDEDGAYTTTCGMAAFDDIQVGGDLSDFETDDDGWALEPSPAGIGDFTSLADLADLGPTLTFCPCSIRDSVLVFHDPANGHPEGQNNFAASPWIDLVRGGDVARPGKLFIYDIYAEMPFGNGVFLQLDARYVPYTCPTTGAIGISPWVNPATFFEFGSVPFCSVPGSPRTRDFSSIIPAAATQVQLGIGVVKFCQFVYPNCTGITNWTPWIDHVALGLYGTANAPVVTTTTFDRFQDNFAADGTLNPASPGRFDVNRLRGASTPIAGSILGDTLCARGDGGNVEVRLVFKIEPGPFTNEALLNVQVLRWTWEPALNGRYGTDASPLSWPNWYSARMDTAESFGTPSLAVWMSTFHESDPGFAGTDRTADPLDRNRLANDIIPDHIFTPGSRIDYLVASRYRPPDPRNPGGGIWTVDPDTTDGRFREAEILPSSMAADTTWNCVLYVDHHEDRDQRDQQIEELGLRMALGGPGNNPEGTRHDRLDVQTPSSNQMSFGRPLRTQYGCSTSQAFAYRGIVWHSAGLSSFQLTNEDAAILDPWLRFDKPLSRGFWGSGAGLARSMNTTGGLAKSFMNGTLGTTFNCSAIRLLGCPSPLGGIDTTYCLPTASVAGAYFTSSIVPRVRGNGCPQIQSYGVLGANGAVSTARGQLDYIKSGAAQSFASVTNQVSTGGNYRTVLDAPSAGQLRTNPGYYAVGCDDPSASFVRTDDILNWLGASLLCNIPPGYLSEVPPGSGEGTPGPRPSLGAAWPNPLTAGTRVRIGFSGGVAGTRVRLDIFDVTGRLVRRLVDGPLPAGSADVVWDVKDTGGQPVPAGLYFYRMSAPGFDEARKLLIIN